ncbi:hypothetical protein RUM44_000280 [Polyplax serrata]|uniref:Small EDRK-rich factor-like N-terminal domain-containing protein n=1 Tax=Polyplax serrata TaxID=468196 RepID=A0ABR1B500_POLSC
MARGAFRRIPTGDCGDTQDQVPGSKVRKNKVVCGRKENNNSSKFPSCVCFWQLSDMFDTNQKVAGGGDDKEEENQRKRRIKQKTKVHEKEMARLAAHGGNPK